MLFGRRNWFKTLPNPSANVWAEQIHSGDRFREILQCERMRADRSGIRFCTVVFALDAANPSECAKFVANLRSRMRATDHAGLLSENEVAVVLWDTLEPGARTYVECVESHPSSSCVLSRTIYLYPDPTPPGGFRDETTGRDGVSQADPTPSRKVAVEPLDVLFVQKLPVWKRCVDIAGAALGLIALAPLLAATAVLIKLTSRGPVLFKQERDGLGGRRFTIYKFRTMRVDAERLKAELRKFSEQDGPAFKLTHDPRITKIGKFLRKSCIDELPQLWNVVKGDMTLVGPRPLDSKEAEKIQGWGRRRGDLEF